MGVSVFYVYRFALNHTAISTHQAEEKASTAVDGEFGFVFSLIMCHLKERFLGLFLFFFSSWRNPLVEIRALFLAIRSHHLHRKVEVECRLIFKCPIYRDGETSIFVRLYRTREELRAVVRATSSAAVETPSIED